MLINMQRKEGAHADFTEWDFANGIEELNPFLNKMLNHALSVVFSKDGIEAALEVGSHGVTENDLLIDCEILINDYEAFALAKFSLRELIAEAVEFVDEGDIKKMAAALRSLADTISTNA